MTKKEIKETTKVTMPSDRLLTVQLDSFSVGRTHIACSGPLLVALKVVEAELRKRRSLYSAMNDLANSGPRIPPAMDAEIASAKIECQSRFVDRCDFNSRICHPVRKICAEFSSWVSPGFEHQTAMIGKAVAMSQGDRSFAGDAIF
jgi:hypothetical protein